MLAHLKKTEIRPPRLWRQLLYNTWRTEVKINTKCNTFQSSSSIITILYLHHDDNDVRGRQRGLHMTEVSRELNNGVPNAKKLIMRPIIAVRKVVRKKTGLCGKNSQTGGGLTQTHFLMSTYQVIFGMPKWFWGAKTCFTESGEVISDQF